MAKSVEDLFESYQENYIALLCYPVDHITQIFPDSSGDVRNIQLICNQRRFDRTVNHLGYYMKNLMYSEFSGFMVFLNLLRSVRASVYKQFYEIRLCLISSI